MVMADLSFMAPVFVISFKWREDDVLFHPYSESTAILNIYYILQKNNTQSYLTNYL